MSAPLKGQKVKQNMLTPEMEQFQAIMKERYAQFPDLDSVPFSEVRDIVAQVREPFSSGGPEMVKTTEQFVPVSGDKKVRIRMHRPTTDETLPCLFYLHGGGWVMFSLDTHDRLMREYAARAGVCVIGIDYSLAPESRYPTQVNESVAAVLWCAEHAQDLGIDAGKLAIGGDSAGGNLSMATCLKLQEQGKASLIKAMILNYAVVDSAIALDPVVRPQEVEYLLTTEEMIWFWHNYLGDIQKDGIEPFVSPMLADLTKMPAVYMAIAGCDILCGDNLRMEKRLKESGVDVKAVVYEGAIHGFLETASLGGIANVALQETADWLKNRLGM
ncbi:alpha/beta hydrolase [Kordiimonas pumila]|uniref:Alpha/beta hydrolase n=1 Tax=Kordiimonas pumila TaxID=2161677 RepID=A0ABV7D026_9PROT|nr:alpha/beta hydrolase [Kordiimonas pumila]